MQDAAAEVVAVEAPERLLADFLFRQAVLYELKVVHALLGGALAVHGAAAGHAVV